MAVSAKDINNKNKLEEDLLAIRERLIFAFEGSGDGYWDWIISTNKIYYSTRYFEMLGYSENELPSDFNSWESLIHPDDLKFALQMLDKHLNDQSFPYQFEYRLKCKNGEWLWVADYGKVVEWDENGKPTRMSGTHRDVNKQHLMEEELIRTNQELRLLYEAEKDLSSSLDTEVINDKIYYTIRQLMSCDALIISFFDKDTELIHTKCIWAEGIKVDINTINVPPIPLAPSGYGIQSRVIRTGQPEVITDYQEYYKKTIHKHSYQDDEKGDAKKLYGSGIVVPMKLSKETIGALQVFSYKGDDYSNEHVRLLEALASQLSIAATNAALYQQAQIEIKERSKVAKQLSESQKKLQESNESLHALADHLQKIREDERRNISREIHDQLGQELTVLKMDISLLKNKIEKSVKKAAKDKISKQLDSMMEMSDHAINTIRRISRELRPDVLDKLGLQEGLEWYMEEFKNKTNINTYLNYPLKDLVLNPRLSSTIFRIIQESLTNVAKHSKAKNVKIDLEIRDEILHIFVKDDGIGITKEKSENVKSLGLIGINERAYSFGGGMVINGEPGKGTELLVYIPYKDK